MYDNNILTWAKQKLGSPEPPQLIIDSQWAIPVKKGNSIVDINETMTEAKVMCQGASLIFCLECSFLVKDRSKSGQCEICQKMLENSLKKHKEVPGINERATKSHSNVKLSSLCSSQLLERARNLSNQVKKLGDQNRNLRIMLN